MYADAGRLGYVFYDKMVDFVRTLSDAEYQALRQGIANALNIDTSNGDDAYSAALEAAQQEITILRQDLEKAQEEIDNQAEELEAAANRVAALEEEKKAAAVRETVEPVDGWLREELAAAKREAEIYKGLYEDMLARALG